MNINHHIPVLVEVIAERAAGARRVVDATLGDGGHAARFLADGAEVLGIDRDPDAIATARARLGEDRISYLLSPYAAAEAIAAVVAFTPDFILLDLGVSSRQFDDESRGFTFRPGAPLDMRMGTAGETAAEWLNTASRDEIERVLREYADERRASRMANEIVRRRGNAAFETSDHLINAIRGVLGPRSGPPDFARIFQSVRIAVNDELAGLGLALPAFRKSLPVGGTLAVISYHSGEDRLVKGMYRDWSVGCICPPGLPRCVCGHVSLGEADPRRAIIPSQEEIAANPRARSAKLRFFRVQDAG